MRIDISELTETFPDCRVAVIVADRFTITSTRPVELAALTAMLKRSCLADRFGARVRPSKFRLSAD
jgi:hypothetical protein